MAFRKGGAAAQEEGAKARGGKFARVNYLSMEKDEQVVLRYITDSPDWVYVDQHVSAPTKNKPRDYQGNWPASMPATCRYDKGFTDEQTGKRDYDDCYICDAGLTDQWGKVCTPKLRVWAIACIREEVIGTEEMAQDGQIEANQVGKRIGFRDAVREIEERNEKGEPTGKTVQERALVVVNQATSNFFNGLQSMYGIYGTVCDRDYVVIRTGDGTDTDYDHIPLDKTEGLMPGTERWKRYEESVQQQNLDLEAIIRDKASDDYFARFFDPDKTPEPRESKQKGGPKSNTPPAPAAATNDVDPERLEAMRARVRGHGAKAATSGANALDVD